MPIFLLPFILAQISFLFNRIFFYFVYGWFPLRHFSFTSLSLSLIPSLCLSISISVSLTFSSCYTLFSRSHSLFLPFNFISSLSLSHSVSVSLFLFLDTYMFFEIIVRVVFIQIDKKYSLLSVA